MFFFLAFEEKFGISLFFFDHSSIISYWLQNIHWVLACYLNHVYICFRAGQGACFLTPSFQDVAPYSRLSLMSISRSSLQDKHLACHTALRFSKVSDFF